MKAFKRARREEQAVGHGYRGYALAPLRGVSQPSVLKNVHIPPNISSTENSLTRIEQNKQVVLFYERNRFVLCSLSLDTRERLFSDIPLLLLAVRSGGGATHTTHDTCFLPCVIPTGSFYYTACTWRGRTFGQGF